MKAIFTFAFVVALGFSSSASDLFLRVKGYGEFYVSVENQTHYNSANIFKFFDLSPGNKTVVVRNRMTNAVHSSSAFYLKSNERVVVEVAQNGFFKIIQRNPIQVVNWYTTLEQNNPYHPNPNFPNPGFPHPGHPTYPNGNFSGVNYVSDQMFGQFLSAFKEESMDNSKLEFAESFVLKNALSAQQISIIAKEFSFDSNRLVFAKKAYTNCYDKQYYFLLKETFSFSSNYSALLKYINGSM